MLVDVNAPVLAVPVVEILDAVNAPVLAVPAVEILDAVNAPVLAVPEVEILDAVNAPVLAVLVVEIDDAVRLPPEIFPKDIKLLHVKLPVANDFAVFNVMVVGVIVSIASRVIVVPVPEVLILIENVPIS